MMYKKFFLNLTAVMMIALTSICLAACGSDGDNDALVSKSELIGTWYTLEDDWIMVFTESSVTIYEIWNNSGRYSLNPYTQTSTYTLSGNKIIDKEGRSSVISVKGDKMALTSDGYTTTYTKFNGTPQQLIESLNNGNLNPGGNPSETKSVVGVWESGNYFLSMSSDGFLTAYFAERFLDCGNYTVNNGNLITCNNTYYARPTQYTIKSLTATQLQVEISYVDVYGENQSKFLTFTKSDKIPVTKDNPVVGKSYTTYFSASSTVRITTSFTTFNTGTKTANGGNMAKYPMAMYYIFFNNRVYYQTFKTTVQMPSIGGWNPTTEITVWELEFASNGTISSHHNITSTAL